MNRMLKTICAGLLLVPALSQAEGFSYKFVEVGYEHTKVDNFSDADGDGFALRGAFALAPNWHLFGSYTDTSVEVDAAPNADIDLTDWKLGFGYNRALNDKVDFLARLAYLKGEAEGSAPGLGTISLDDDGYGVSVGLRAMPAAALEIEGSVDYSDFSDSGDDVAFGVSGRYHFTEMFAAGLRANIGDDVKTYGVDFRINFK